MLYQNDLVFAAIFVPKNSAGKWNFMAWHCSEANQCVMSKVILQEPFLEKKNHHFSWVAKFSPVTVIKACLQTLKQKNLLLS